MAVSLYIEAVGVLAPDCLMVRSHGIFNAGDLLVAQRKLSTHPMIQAGANVLNDARDVDFSTAARDVEAAARSLRPETTQMPTNRVAVVVANDLGLEAIRMYLSLREVGDAHTVVRSVPDGLAFLGMPADLEARVDALRAAES